MVEAAHSPGEAADAQPAETRPAETPAQPSEPAAEEPKSYTLAEYARVAQYCRENPGAKLVEGLYVDLGSHKAKPGKEAKQGIPRRHIHAAWEDLPANLTRKPGERD